MKKLLLTTILTLSTTTAFAGTLTKVRTEVCEQQTDILEELKFKQESFPGLTRKLSDAVNRFCSDSQIKIQDYVNETIQALKTEQVKDFAALKIDDNLVNQQQIISAITAASTDDQLTGVYYFDGLLMAGKTKIEISENCNEECLSNIETYARVYSLAQHIATRYYLIEKNAAQSCAKDQPAKNLIDLLSKSTIDFNQKDVQEVKNVFDSESTLCAGMNGLTAIGLCTSLAIDMSFAKKDLAKPENKELRTALREFAKHFPTRSETPNGFSCELKNIVK